MFGNLLKVLEDLEGANVLVKHRGSFFASYDIDLHMDYEQLLSVCQILALYEQDAEMTFEVSF